MPVYFIQAGRYGPVKIGYAADPEERRATLQTAHYKKLRIVAVMPGDEAQERSLHERFAAQRIRGEWFAVCAGIASLMEAFATSQQVVVESPDGAIRTIQDLTRAVGSQVRAANLLGMSPQSFSNAKASGALPRRDAVGQRARLAAAGYDAAWSLWGIEVVASETADGSA